MEAVQTSSYHHAAGAILGSVAAAVSPHPPSQQLGNFLSSLALGTLLLLGVSVFEKKKKGESLQFYSPKMLDCKFNWWITHLLNYNLHLPTHQTGLLSAN